MAASLPPLGAFEIRAIREYPAEIAALKARGIAMVGRADLPPQPFRLPFRWNADPLADRNWMFQLHAWRLLDPHLNRLRHEPDHPEAWDEVLAIIADWHRDNIRGRPGRFTWFDMSTGLRALRLACLVMTARRHGVELPAMIADLVDRHAEVLADPARLSPANHGLFQMNGLMALAWLHPDRPWAGAAHRYAVEQMSALLQRQLGPEGIHTEDAPYYHIFATRKIARILAAPWWRIPQMGPMHAHVARAEVAFGWMTDPADRCVPVGDSSESPMTTQQPPILEQWPHARQEACLGAVLDGYGVVRSAPELPLEKSVLLFLTASFHEHGHKHADCLSLVWQEGGANILVDSGKYGYQRDAIRPYFLSTRAHNTVEIDDEDSAVRGHAYGSGMRRVAPLGRAWLIEAEADRRHLGARHRRVVLFRPGRFVLAVDHIVPAAGPAIRVSGPRRFTSWWHFDPGIALEPETAGHAWRGTGLRDGGGLRVSHATAAEGGQGGLHRGETAPRLQGWVSGSYLEYRPAPVLGFSARTPAGYFGATLIEIMDADAAPGLRLERPGAAAIALAPAAGPRPAMRSFRFGEFVLEAAATLLELPPA